MIELVRKEVKKRTFRVEGKTDLVKLISIFARNGVTFRCEPLMGGNIAYVDTLNFANKVDKLMQD